MLIMQTTQKIVSTLMPWYEALNLQPLIKAVIVLMSAIGTGHIVRDLSHREI